MGVINVQVCSIQSDDIENPDNNNDEGRDSPSTCTQESGYGSTCTDSLSYRDTCDNDVDTDTCVAQTIHAQTQTRDKVSHRTTKWLTFSINLYNFFDKCLHASICTASTCIFDVKHFCNQPIQFCIQYYLLHAIHHR